MNTYIAQYGFEEFEVPDYEIESISTETEDVKIRFHLTDGTYANQWIEISSVRMSEEVADENGDGALLFEFDSSLGSDESCNECLDLLQIAHNIVKVLIIDIMNTYGHSNDTVE